VWWRGWASPEKNDKFGCIFTRILRFSRKTKLAKSAKIMQKFTVRPRGGGVTPFCQKGVTPPPPEYATVFRHGTENFKEYLIHSKLK